MPNYKYELRDAGGHVSSGLITATSVMDATNMVRSQGGFLLSIAPAASGPADLLTRMQSISIEFGPSLKDVQVFTNQLAVMIKAGINIRSAIEGICDQVEKPKMKKILHQIKGDVESGKTFSEALSRFPKVFSPLYINMVKASELSGNFGHMLERISNYLSQQVETRNMVRGAMIYPGIIATMAITTTTFLLTFVLPKFSALFAGKESLLPGPTTMLLAISDFLRNDWYVVIAGIVGMAVGIFYGLKTTIGRELWDKAKLKLPLFKKMFRALYITRGLHTMGEMVNAGVPMLETLTITADVSGNTLYKSMWKSVHASVKTGNKICTPLMKQNLLPKNVVQMISAGEESGRLGEVMSDIAEYYANELKNTIKSVTAMLEPLMIVIMGVVVGFIAMSIILPIFKMSSLVH